MLVLAFHDVSDAPASGGGVWRYTVGRAAFEEHLRVVARRGVPVVNLETEAPRARPPRGAILFTFDDGRTSALETVAPALESHGWRGHFFVVSSWIGRPGFLSAGQLRELRARGHRVGSHSATHPERMTLLPDAALRAEWFSSRARLEDLLGEAVVTASIPNGYADARVWESALASGFTWVFTSEPTIRARALRGGLILGRFCIRRHASSRLVDALVRGAWWPRCRQYVAWRAGELAKACLGGFYLQARARILTWLSPAADELPR